MREAVERLWPETSWIGDPALRESVFRTWIMAFDESPLGPEDLERIPFTLLVSDCPATLMEHKRCVVTTYGRELTRQIDFPKGDPRNPLTDAEIEEKFDALAEPVLGADQFKR